MISFAYKYADLWMDRSYTRTQISDAGERTSADLDIDDTRRAKTGHTTLSHATCMRGLQRHVNTHRITAFACSRRTSCATHIREVVLIRFGEPRRKIFVVHDLSSHYYLGLAPRPSHVAEALLLRPQPVRPSAAQWPQNMLKICQSPPDEERREGGDERQ